MPEIIVSLTGAEYGASLKKKARKQMQSAIIFILIALIGLAFMTYLLWSVIHV